MKRRQEESDGKPRIEVGMKYRWRTCPRFLEEPWASASFVITHIEDGCVRYRYMDKVPYNSHACRSLAFFQTYTLPAEDEIACQELLNGPANDARVAKAMLERDADRTKDQNPYVFGTPEPMLSGLGMVSAWDLWSRRRK